MGIETAEMPKARELIEQAAKDAKKKTPGYGWTDGQKDMATKMHRDGRSLADITRELRKPAADIARFLKLNERYNSSAIHAEIKLLHEEGFTTATIAEILDADGILTSRGNRWTKNSVTNVLFHLRKRGELE